MAAAAAAHILVLPHPAQGHINPALAFAKRLASMGVEVTILITTDLSKKASFSDCAPVAIAHISDGAEEVKETESFEAYFRRFRGVLSANLAEFIDNNKRSASPAKLVVYDSTMPWALDVAHERGLLGAPFFTQSGAVSAIFYHLKQGLLKFPYEECDDGVLLPSLPSLAVKDLPSLSLFMDSNQTILNLLADQFFNLERADWIFINTFDMLEQEVYIFSLISNSFHFIHNLSFFPLYKNYPF